MLGEVLSTFVQNGRTTAIVRVNELIVEVVLEPAFDAAGDVHGYHAWIRADGNTHTSEDAALFAAMQDVARMSRVQRLAVVHLRTGEVLNAC